MTKRLNFTKPVKREALARSGGLCEANGPWYGLEEGKRCNAPLSAGVEFDHIDLDANSKDRSLGNCAAVCPKCHDFKTRKIDTPKAAKTVRQQDKARGISKPDGKAWGKKPKPERIGKQSLPPRRLFG